MHIKLIFAAILFCLTFIGNVLAQSVPPNVGNIQASYENGEVTVTWTAVEDSSGIAFYRIYYSRESIMDNQGNYDDFERTGGPETMYVFPVAPYNGTKLYLSVLAVNTAGMESEAFLSEASVDIPGEVATTLPPTLPLISSPSSSVASSSSSVMSEMMSPVSEEPPEEIPADSGQAFFMTHALTTSGTGVFLYFTKSIDVLSLITPADVIILDGSGAKLDVMEVFMNGNELGLETDMQDAEKLYTVASIGQIQSEDGSQLQTAGTVIIFRGHQSAADNGMNYVESPDLPPPDTTPPENARNLRLQHMLRNDGMYDVDAMWNASPDTDNDLQSYEVSTSYDGQLYFDPQNLNKDELTIRYTSITPGIFGVLVKAKDNVGNISQGITQIIHLPETGAEILGALFLSGALAGRKVVKHRRQRK